MPTLNTVVGLEKMRESTNVWKPPDIYWHLANVRAFLPHLLPETFENRSPHVRWGQKQTIHLWKEMGHSGCTVEMCEAKTKNVKIDHHCGRNRCPTF